MRLSPSDPVNPSFYRPSTQLPPSMEDEAEDIQYFEYLRAHGIELVGYDRIEYTPGRFHDEPVLSDDNCPLPPLPYEYASGPQSLEDASFYVQEELNREAMIEYMEERNLRQNV